jgi:hypothetical protein
MTVQIRHLTVVAVPAKGISFPGAMACVMAAQSGHGTMSISDNFDTRIARVFFLNCEVVLVN